MWLAFLVASFSVAVIFLSITIYDCAHAFRKIKIKPLTSLFFGNIVSAMLMFFPMHLTDASVTSLRGVRAIFLSIFNSIQIFTGGCEFSVIRDGLAECPVWLVSFYHLWASILLVAAPTLTFGFVLSLFKKLSAYLKYIFSFFGNVYVFSELNDKSVVLAKDIKKSDEKAVIVFTDVFEGNEETSYELVEEAKKLHAICFKNDILVVEFKNHSKKKPISFFAIGEDETENLNQSLKLIEKYKNRENANIYVFSTKVESGILLSSTDKGKMRVRRINEVQSLINHLLYERGEIIFDIDKVNPDGTKDISVVVIGMGRHGTEMVKALSWYGQMDGYNLEINAFDKDPLAEEKFVALAPELMSPAYNGTHIHGEAQYKITIHPNADVDTITFVNEIKKISNATYVLVALGDDDVNIRTAINLRMHFERMKIHPVIQAIVYNSQQKRALQGIKNFAGQSYDVEFIGDLESSYVEEVIIKSKLEASAFEHHQSYVENLLKDENGYKKVLARYLSEKDLTLSELREQYKHDGKYNLANDKDNSEENREFYDLLKAHEEERFWKFEYNYRSSIATAAHRQAKIICGVMGARDNQRELTPEEEEAIQILENRRWNAYTRAEGYIYSGSRDEKSRNDLGKMHHSLVEHDRLTDAEKKRNSEVGTKR